VFCGYTALGKTTHIGAGWPDNDDSGFPVRPASSSPRRYTEIGTSTHDRCEQVPAALNLPAPKGKLAEDVPQPLRHFPRCGYPGYD
jgi:hypothetical protein